MKCKKNKSKKRRPKQKMSLGGQVYATGIMPNFTNDELYNNALNFQKIQSEVNANPFLNALQIGFASLPMLWEKFGGGQGMATGGVVKDVEVEGGEVAETPMGQLMKFMGANHENGGVDATLPIGTKVYSKRLKKDGETMAKRKMDREMKMSRMRNKLNNNPHDIILKNTAKRLDKVNKKLDEMDMAMQENMRQMMTMMNIMDNGNNEKFQSGGVIEYGDPRYPSFMWGLPMPINKLNPREPNIKPEMADVKLPETEDKNNKPKRNLKTSLSEFFKDDSNSGYIGYGDPFVLAGDIMNTISPLKTLAESRGADTPNINFYKTYGQSALDKTRSLYDLVNKSTSTMKREARDNFMMQKNRSNARSVNTQRALDILNYMGLNKTLESIEQNKYRQLAGVTNQEANLSLNLDRMRMLGEQQKDQANRQDLDNYYSMKSQALQQFGRGMQETGKDLNQLKYNDMMRFLLEAGNKYNMSVNNKGQIVAGSPVEEQTAGSLYGSENFKSWQAELPTIYQQFNQGNREVTEKSLQEYKHKMEFGNATPEAIDWFVTSKGMTREDLSRAINGDESVLSKYNLNAKEKARLRSFALSDAEKKEIDSNLKILQYAMPVNYYNPTGSEYLYSLIPSMSIAFNPMITPTPTTLGYTSYGNKNTGNSNKKSKKTKKTK